MQINIIFNKMQILTFIKREGNVYYNNIKSFKNQNPSLLKSGV